MPPETSKIINRFSCVLLLAIVITSCASHDVNSTNNDDSAGVYLQLGVRYMDLGKLEIAKENLLLALKKDPDNTQVHNAFAFLYEKLNNYDHAKEQYEIALDKSPDDWNVQNNFGRFLCDRGEYEQGMVLLIKAISTQLNDRQWLALTNAGRCQLAMQQKQSAKAYFRQALILNNEYAPALLEMQKISYENGEYWAAKGYLQRYLGVANHTSGTLWFGMQTERALGNEALAKEYQNLLVEKFPLSNEAKRIAGIKKF
ncbi:MAG: type IV pilus biogenesis/stability protein PilW [Methylococcales bacterium]|nr:type IV pilus biogenesis/stability protein PilW [Methylococcales bacterium]